MIYMSPDNVPELKGLDKQEQKRLFKECSKEGRKRMGSAFWVRLAIFIAVTAVLVYIFPMGGLIGGLMLGVSIGVLAVFIVQTPMIDAGRPWLQEQGYPKK